MMRGEKGMALQAMRMKMTEQIRATQVMDAYLANDECLKSAGLRGLRSIMMRLAKGEIAERLEIWRTAKRWSVTKYVEALKRSLAAQEQEMAVYESQADSQIKNAAFRQMRAVMTRLVKCDVSERIEIWRTMKTSHVSYKRQQEMSMFMTEVDSHLKNTAMRQVMGVTMRMVMGKITQIIARWRGALHACQVESLAATVTERFEKIKQVSTMKANILVEMRSTEMVAALKRMKLVFTQIMRGEKAVALHSIRDNMKLDHQQGHLEALRADGNDEVAAMEAMATWQLRNIFFRYLRSALMRLAKSEVAERLEIWRTAKKWAMLQKTNTIAALKQIHLIMIGMHLTLNLTLNLTLTLKFHHHRHAEGQERCETACDTFDSE